MFEAYAKLAPTPTKRIEIKEYLTPEDSTNRIIGIVSHKIKDRCFFIPSIPITRGIQKRRLSMTPEKNTESLLSYINDP